MKVLHVVGARPNFMKVAPIMAEMSQYPEQFGQCLVHTGQHYDHQMSEVFFNELNLPTPHYQLNVGSGSHSEQAARVMLAFEPVLLEQRPDIVFVVGDVNSTLACALVCAKSGVPVAHVEAGLRSWDRTMPEETNRVLTDQLSTLLFTPSRDADNNLRREGIADDRIYFVGNIMIDTLARLLPQARGRDTLCRFNLRSGEYVLATLHRPSNVDAPCKLQGVMAALSEIGHTNPVVFPVHPRTRRTLEEFSIPIAGGIRLIEPQSYLDFLSLTLNARLVITDSGGVQEETTFLGIPCLTLRPNTERPITLTQGTNRLVPLGAGFLVSAFHDAMDQACCSPSIPDQWDGNAAKRIVSVLRAWKAGSRG